MSKEWRRSIERRMDKEFFYHLIQELCDEMNIKLEKLSFGWILQLTKGEKVRHISNYLFDNNPQATGNIVADKYATYEVLKSQNIPIIKHTMVFHPTIRETWVPQEGNWNNIITEFSKYGTLVVKPNHQCKGKNVALCHDLREVEIAIQKIFSQNETSLSICPYYEIKTEYRAFYLKGEILLIYGKTKPFVIGDGKTNLKTLIEKLQLKENIILEDNQKENEIPKKGQKFEISWKHNLSGGAIPKILEKGELYQKIEEIAQKAGKAMNMNFTTIDIIQTIEDELYVMEMNAGVCGDIFAQTIENGYEIMKEIYRKELEDMFQ